MPSINNNSDRKKPLLNFVAVPFIFLASFGLLIGLASWREHRAAEVERLRPMCEGSLGVHMAAADQFEDWESVGWVDARMYVKLQLTRDTYEKAHAIAMEKWQPHLVWLQWPWTLPQSNEQFGKTYSFHGQGMIFLPATRQVYLAWW